MGTSLLEGIVKKESREYCVPRMQANKDKNKNSSIAMGTSLLENIVKRESREHRIRELRKEYFKLKAVDPSVLQQDALKTKSVMQQCNINLENTAYVPSTHYTTEYRRSTGVAECVSTKLMEHSKHVLSNSKFS